MATAVAQPSTPSSSRFGKLLNKIRTTPSSSSLSNNNGHSYSTPTLQRATSKGSNTYAPTNASSVSVNSLSPSLLMDLEMPTFEGDWLNKDWSPHVGSNHPSPYGTKVGATTTDSLVSVATNSAASSTHLPLEEDSTSRAQQPTKYTRTAPSTTSSSLNFDARPPPSISPPLLSTTTTSTTHGSGSSYVSSAYTSSGSAAGSGGSMGGASLDSSGDGIRKKPLLLSRSTSATGEGGLKGLAKWASRDLLGRSLGREEKRSATGTTSMMDAVDRNEGERRASADDYKSPPNPGYQSQSLSSRVGLRNFASTSSQPMTALGNEITPGVPRLGLSNPASHRTRRRPLVGDNVTLAKPRRAQRVVVTQDDAANDGGSEGGEAASSGGSAEQNRTIPSSPGSHSRSQSELVARSSPRLETMSSDRAATTVTLPLQNPHASTSTSNSMQRYDERSTATESSFGSSRPSSALDTYTRESSYTSLRPSPPTSGSLEASKPPLRTTQAPQSSAVLRERMLRSATPPDFNSYSQSQSSGGSGSAPSSSSPPRQSSVSSSSRAALLEQRRTQVVEETEARLAAEPSRPSSAMSTSMAAGRSGRTSEEENRNAHRGGAVAMMGRTSTEGSREETMVPRSGSSASNYREGNSMTSGSGSGNGSGEGGATTTMRQGPPPLISRSSGGPANFEPVPEQPEYAHHPPPPSSSSRTAPFQPQASTQQLPYQSPVDKENDYPLRVAFPRQAPPPPPSSSSAFPPTSAPQVTPSYAARPLQSRPVLGETYRANSTAAPPPQQPPPQHHQYAPKERVMAEYVVPLRDVSPGLGAVEENTPNVTRQQRHYSGANPNMVGGMGPPVVSMQQYQQQQFQQQPVQQLQQQQHQPLQQQQYQESVVATKPPGKKVQPPIVVNGKQYNRIGLLGRGGSSRVFRVVDEKNQLYAIKRVDISKNDAESRNSFINEINLLQKLRDHPQIISLVDAEMNEAKRTLLMVMEVGETDLNNLLVGDAGKPVSMNFIRYIWEQMLQAVQVIHMENIVHTDLKPANFVLVKGRLKLIDFGISKAIANDTTNIGRDQQIGTANYMPPEALMDSGMGQGGKRLMKLGRPADVWSLGCILYQMTYGRTPFSHLRDVQQKIMAIQNPRYVIDFASSVCPVDVRGEENKELEVRIGEDLIDAMRSCLRFDPKTRATIPMLLQGKFLRPGNS